MSIVGSIIQSSGVGGGLTVNEETLVANKTIADGDPIIQILDTNGTDRDATLPATPTVGSVFRLTNACIPSAITGTLSVKVGTDTVALFILEHGATAEFVYTANGWIAIADGLSVKRTGANAFENKNAVSLGNDARAYPASSDSNNSAIAIGEGSYAINSIMIGAATTNINGANVQIGNNIAGSGSYKTCLGMSSYGTGDYVVSIGYQTTPLAQATCLGSRADAGASNQIILGYNNTGTTKPAAMLKTLFTSSTSLKVEEIG